MAKKRRKLNKVSNLPDGKQNLRNLILNLEGMMKKSEYPAMQKYYEEKIEEAKDKLEGKKKS